MIRLAITHRFLPARLNEPTIHWVGQRPIVTRQNGKFTPLVLYETGNAGQLDKVYLDVLSPGAA